jgi:hypothetical protein
MEKQSKRKINSFENEFSIDYRVNRELEFFDYTSKFIQMIDKSIITNEQLTISSYRIGSGRTSLLLEIAHFKKYRISLHAKNKQFIKKNIKIKMCFTRKDVIKEIRKAHNNWKYKSILVLDEIFTINPHFSLFPHEYNDIRNVVSKQVDIFYALAEKPSQFDGITVTMIGEGKRGDRILFLMSYIEHGRLEEGYVIIEKYLPNKVQKKYFKRKGKQINNMMDVTKKYLENQEKKLLKTKKGLKID